MSKTYYISGYNLNYKCVVTGNICNIYKANKVMDSLIGDDIPNHGSDEDFDLYDTYNFVKIYIKEHEFGDFIMLELIDKIFIIVNKTVIMQFHLPLPFDSFVLDDDENISFIELYNGDDLVYNMRECWDRFSDNDGNIIIAAILDNVE